MQENIFESILKVQEDELKRIRKLYFPLIKKGIIAGYNLYPKQFDYSKGKLFLNYLHSDLKLSDRHFKELSLKIKKRTDVNLEERVTINNKLIDRTEKIDREADYLTTTSWEDPPNMRYFDLNGTELPREEAKGEDQVIGESYQYDLLIRVKDESELRALVDSFKIFASKYMLDRKGRKIMVNKRMVLNNSAVFSSYDIPLLVCTCTNNRKPSKLEDFILINQIDIKEHLGEMPIMWSTLLKTKTKYLCGLFNERNQEVTVKKRYALRVFVEDYLEA